METTIDLTDEYIAGIWQICQTVYLQHGYKLRFPQCTDRTKTYQWRYIKAIAKKFQEWDFDKATAAKFVEVAVNRAKLRGVLRKGLAVLHQDNMLDACYRIMTEESKRSGSTLDMLESMRKWYVEHNCAKTALQKPHAHSLSNLILWFRSNKISPLFMALSKSCCIALNILSDDEKMLMPTLATLYRLRSDFVMNIANAQKAKIIFGDDWRNI